MQSLSRCFYTGLDEHLLVVIWKQHVWKTGGGSIKSVTPFWPLRYLLQTLHSKLICSTINRLISLIGARVCMFQSLEHFGHTLALASWLLSQADPFLLKLSAVPLFFLFCFESCCPNPRPFSSRLLFLTLCWGCLFSLSASLYSSTMSVVERSLCAPLLLCWSANAELNRDAVYLSVFFYFLFL